MCVLPGPAACEKIVDTRRGERPALSAPEFEALCGTGLLTLPAYRFARARGEGGACVRACVRARASPGRARSAVTVQTPARITSRVRARPTCVGRQFCSSIFWQLVI